MAKFAKGDKVIRVSDGVVHRINRIVKVQGLDEVCYELVSGEWDVLLADLYAENVLEPVPPPPTCECCGQVLPVAK